MRKNKNKDAYTPDTALSDALEEINSGGEIDNKNPNKEENASTSHIVGVLRKHFKTKLKILLNVDLSNPIFAIFSSDISCYDPIIKEFTSLATGKYILNQEFIKTNSLILGIPASSYASDVALIESLKALGAINNNSAMPQFTNLLSLTNEITPSLGSGISQEDSVTAPTDTHYPSDITPQEKMVSQTDIAVPTATEKTDSPEVPESIEKRLLEIVPSGEKQSTLPIHQEFSQVPAQKDTGIDIIETATSGRNYLQVEGALSEKAYGKIFDEIEKLGISEAIVTASYQVDKRPETISHLSERQGYALLRKLKDKPIAYWQMQSSKLSPVTKSQSKKAGAIEVKNGTKKRVISKGKDRVFKGLEQRKITPRVMKERRGIRRLLHDLPQEVVSQSHASLPEKMSAIETISYIDSLDESALMELSKALTILTSKHSG